MDRRREMLKKVSGGGGILGYVDDGLLAMYDGIQNTRSGHSSSLSVWEDLSGNERDINYVANGNGITVNADNVKFNGGYFINDEHNLSVDTVKTLEVVCNIPAGNQVIVNFGYNNFMFGSAPDGLIYVHASSRWLCDNIFNVKNSYSARTQNTTSPQEVFVNNTEITERGRNASWSAATHYSLGYYPTTQYNFTGNLYCVRIYNRELTDEELLQNYNNDVRRFGTMGV